MSREEAARYIGVAASKFDEMVSDHRMPTPKQIDGRVIWDRLELDAAFTDLGQAKSIAPQKPSPQFTPQVTTPEQLAKRWGCSARHVRNLISRGDLSASKLGGKLVRIKLSDIEAFERRGGSKVRESNR